MSGLPERQAEAALWFGYAAQDLSTARMLLAEGAPARHVCMMAQQAAEKALKSALVVEDQEPPRSHNLAFLLKALDGSWSVKSVSGNLGSLTGWAVASRYPGDWEAPTQAEAEAALALSAAIVEEVAAGLAARGVLGAG